MKRLRSSVYVLGVLVIVAVPISGVLAWSGISGWRYSGTYNAYSAEIAPARFTDIFTWRFGVPPGYLLIGTAVLTGVFLALAFRKSITDPRVRYCGLVIGSMGVVNLAIVALNSSPWSSKESPAPEARIPTTWSEAADVEIGLYVSLLCCALQIAFGIYIALGLKLGWEAVVESPELKQEDLRRTAKNSEDAQISDANLFSNDQGQASNRIPDAMAALESPTTKQSRGIAVNAVLFLAVTLIGLLPFFSIGALGMSESLNAFRADEGDGQRFWFTVIPVGWVVVVISVVAFGVIALASKRSSRPTKRIENHVLAGFGLIIGAELIASWYYANKQIEDAMGAAVGELVADGNPFAALGGAMVGGISFSPAIGFWLMLAVALAIAGYNVFLIREAGKPTSSVAVTANTTLADGIRELSELRDQGMISDEEFVLAKRKLLGE
jgi:hypothetical protein